MFYVVGAVAVTKSVKSKHILHNELKSAKKIQFQMCVWVVARLPQRLKAMIFEIFSSFRVSFGDPPLENFSENFDFSL